MNINMKKIFKVKFLIKCYCHGIFSYAEAHLSVLAETEAEAIKKVQKDTTFEAINFKASEITLN